MNIKEITNKCFKCKNPKCMNSCPLQLNISEICQLIEHDKEYEAYLKLKANNILLSICGVICPMEHQCAKECLYHKVKGEIFPINKIEQYLTNKYYINDSYEFPEVTNRSVVIVGSGPAGLAAAITLRLAGFKTTVIEAEKNIGGILSTHLPKFRFENTILENKFEELSKHIEFIFNTKVGKDISYDELFKYDYQIIAIGSENPTRMNTSENIYSGHELLKLYNQNKLQFENKKIGILGCGNVAIDIARALKRLNNDVSIIYRRTLDNAPATKNEINEALKENISIHELLSLASFNDGIATFDKMGLKPKVGNERQKFFKTDEQIKEQYDLLVEAYGSNPVFDGLNDYNWFKLINDNTWLTQDNYMNMYFVGDCLLHPSSIAKAIASGKKTALEIIQNEEEIKRIKKDLNNKPIVFGGSFNPLTIAHEEIINYVLNNISKNIVVLPNGDQYKLKNLLPFTTRVEMIKNVFPNISIDDYESKQNFRGTVQYLKDRNHPFFIIGGDSLKDLTKWIDYENLVKDNKFIVFNRNNLDFKQLFETNELLNNYKNNFYILNVSFSPVSSSTFRENKNPLYLSHKVLDYINTNKLY